MPFLGSQPAEQYKSLAKQTITGDGSTAYTLNRSVTNEFDIEVFINNVRQEPTTSYSATGNTITFTAAVTASDSCYIIFQGQAVGTINPPTNSVGTSQIANGGVHTANIANTAITHAKLHTDMDLSSKTVRIDAMNMGTGTDQWQLATQSAVSNRFALRSTHTTLGDGNPFIIYQPTSAGAQNDALVINADGYILKNKQPAFLVKYQPSVGSGNYIVGGTVDHNVGNHFNSATGTFTVPVSGRYHFVAGVLTSSNANARLEMFIHVNGGAALAGNESCGNNQHGSAVISAPLNLTANDSVKFWLSSGSMHNAHANNYFGCYLIG